MLTMFLNLEFEQKLSSMLSGCLRVPQMVIPDRLKEEQQFRFSIYTFSETKTFNINTRAPVSYFQEKLDIFSFVSWWNLTNSNLCNLKVQSWMSSRWNVRFFSEIYVAIFGWKDRKLANEFTFSSLTSFQNLGYFSIFLHEKFRIPLK